MSLIRKLFKHHKQHARFPAMKQAMRNTLGDTLNMEIVTRGEHTWVIERGHGWSRVVSLG